MITERQLQVLRLFANGYTSIEIAAELLIAVRTVEEHLKGCRRTLGAKTSAQAVAIAMRKGVINLIIASCVNQSFYATFTEDYDIVARRPAQSRFSQVRRREC